MAMASSFGVGPVRLSQARHTLSYQQQGPKLSYPFVHNVLAVSTARAQVATITTPAVTKTTLPRRFYHLSHLASDLAVTADVTSTLQPWLQKLTVEDWNALLHDVGNKDWSNAWELFLAFLTHMLGSTTHDRTEPLPPTLEDGLLEVCNSLLRVLCQYRRHAEVELLRSKMQSACITPNAPFYNALLEWYASQGWLDKVSVVLLIMEKANIRRDPNVYEKVAFAYLRDKTAGLDRPKKIMQDLMKEGAPVSMGLFKNLIKGFWKENDPDSVEEVFKAMQLAGHAPDLKVSYKLMQLHGQKGNYERILALLELLSKSGTKPNSTMYVYLVHAYCRAGLMEKAKDVVLSYKTVLGCKPPIIAYNMLIDGFAKGNRHEEAMHVLSDIRADGLKPNPVSYSSMISALVKDGQIEKAENLFTSMFQLNLQPNLYTYQILIRGYTKRNLTRDGHEVYNAMRKSCLEMTNEAYAVVLALYLEGNWYHHAASTLKELERAGITLNAAALSSLIRAFYIVGTKSNPLTRAVQESKLETCKLLSSLFITNPNYPMFKPELVDQLLSFLKMWQKGETVEATSLLYNAFMDCFWRRDLKVMARKVLYEVRKAHVGNAQPQFQDMDWVLDIRGLSIGGSKTALVDWLIEVREKAKGKGLPEGVTMTLITGDEFSLNVYDNRSSKMALSSMLGALGSPFKVSAQDLNKLQASGADVTKWILQDSLKEALSA